jgi:hypothetical protein
LVACEPNRTVRGGEGERERSFADEALRARVRSTDQSSSRMQSGYRCTTTAHRPASVAWHWSAAEPSIDGQNAVITTTLPYGTAETACTDLDSECHVPGRLFPIYSSQAEKRPIQTPRTAAPPFSAPYVRVENKKQKIHLSWLNRRDSTFVTKTKSGRSSAQ